MAGEIQFAVRVVVEAPNNPEDTVTVALTLRDTAVVALGLLLTGRLFPEILEAATEAATKIHEVGDAQEFFGG